MSKRSRLSIDLPSETFEDLNSLMGDLRVKSRLFKAIVVDFIECLRKFTPEERLFFICSVIEGDLKLENYSKTIRKAKDAAERLKNLNPKTPSR